MQYKLLILDVDGVLVKSKDAVVSPGVIQSVNKIKNKVKVVLCTGRTKEDAQRVIDSLDISHNYHIVESGAKVLAPDGTYEYEKLLSGSDVVTIYLASKNEFEKIAVCSNGTWVDYTAGESYDNVTTVSLHSHSQQQTKMILRSLEKLRGTYHIAVGSHWQIPAGNFILITNKEASKKFGIEYVQKKYGITKAETGAIGDMPNDLPLFEASGLKIAMGNGDIELKNKADFVTKHIDEDGVAYAMMTYFS